MSVLVNGSPTKEFVPLKGFRQEDPLAPFLFLIVAEGLAKVVRKIVKSNLVESMEIGVKKVKVNMLQYAGDTLFFCKATTKSVFNIKFFLNCFELASGLKVNFLKSSIGGVGVEQFTIHCFVAIINCDVRKTPFKYLGMPVGGCHRKETFGMGWLKE